MIRIDATTTTHYIDAVDLANTVRSSIDSGRDNPFKPDGEIYRSADPIVDYYKFGPNQSRTQTPDYSELLMTNGKTSKASKTNVRTNKDDKKEAKRLAKLEEEIRKKREKEIKEIHKRLKSFNPEDTEQKSGWKYWMKRHICCCCCRRSESRCSVPRQTISVEIGHDRSGGDNNRQQRLRNNIEFASADQMLVPKGSGEKKTSTLSSYAVSPGLYQEYGRGKNSDKNLDSPSDSKKNSNTTTMISQPIARHHLGPDKSSNHSLNIESVNTGTAETAHGDHR